MRECVMLLVLFGSPFLCSWSPARSSSEECPIKSLTLLSRIVLLFSGSTIRFEVFCDVGRCILYVGLSGCKSTFPIKEVSLSALSWLSLSAIDASVMFGSISFLVIVSWGSVFPSVPKLGWISSSWPLSCWLGVMFI